MPRCSHNPSDPAGQCAGECDLLSPIAGATQKNYSMANDRVRRLSPGGHCIGWCSHGDAVDLVRKKRAKVADATRQRLRAIVELDVRVDSGLPGATLQTYYLESLGNAKWVGVQRRVTADGTLVKWDQNLTFAELRAGRIRSETSRQGACA